MNNLDCIKAAYDMNYAVQWKVLGMKTIVLSCDEVKNTEGVELIITTKTYCEIRGNFFNHWFIGSAFKGQSEIVNNFIITGYLYMGQLGGNEKVPEGQRFRLRATNEIFISEKEQEKSFGTYHLYLLNDYKVSDENFHFHPEEIEPYFD